jgi:uncharacterized protein YjdB
MRSPFIQIAFFVVLFFVSAASPILAAAPEGWLYTEGNKIYKSDGTVFVGAGANIFDTRLCGAGFFHSPEEMLAEVKRRIDVLVDVWGADFVRLCLENRETLGGNWLHGLNVLEDDQYLAHIVEIVEYLQSKGVYVLVSLWWEPTVAVTSMKCPSDGTIEIWKKLARALAPYPNVLFGVVNEPEGKRDGSEDATIWQWMNDTVAAIRVAEVEANAPYQHIIAVQGTQNYARILTYYITHPITAGGGVNIAYETHPYNRQGEEFNKTFITPSQTLPVIIGEFGPATVGGYVAMTEEDADALAKTAEELQIPYLAWSFDHNCSPVLFSGGIGQSLVANDWGERFKGYLIEHNAPIRISDLTAEPKTILYETETDLSFTVKIVDKKNVGINSVKLDLTPLNGPIVDMVQSGDEYSYTFSALAGLSVGEKSVVLRVINGIGEEVSKSISIHVIELAQDPIFFYNDGENHLDNQAPFSYKTSLSEVSTSDPLEGNKHYQIIHEAGACQLVFFFDPTAFISFESLSIGVRNMNGSDIRFQIGDGTGLWEDYKLEGSSNSDYQIITIPIEDIDGIDLMNVDRIGLKFHKFNEGGEVYIDDIKLVPVGGITYVPVAGVSIDPSSATIDGNAIQFTANVTPSNATNKSIDWHSSNPSVASVSSSGKVIGNSVGTTEIIATSRDNSSHFASATVDVISVLDEPLIIYNDNENKLGPVDYSYNVTVSEVTSSSPYEGDSHLRFDHEAGGSNILFSFDSINFEDYESVSFAIKNLTGSDIRLKFGDGSEWDSIEGVKLEVDGTEYNQITLPISAFKGIDLSNVIGLRIIFWRQGASGEVYLDDLKLVPYGISTETPTLVDVIKILSVCSGKPVDITYSTDLDKNQDMRIGIEDVINMLNEMSQ